MLLTLSACRMADSLPADQDIPRVLGNPGNLFTRIDRRKVSCNLPVEGDFPCLQNHNQAACGPYRSSGDFIHAWKYICNCR
jgi:hypothetical protein